jgi:hypothetical protein
MLHDAADAILSTPPVVAGSDRAAVIEEPYLVWSNQHRAWWRANSCGYVKSVLGAGHYTREEAIAISGDTRDHWEDPSETPDELAIPISALPRAIRALVDVGKVGDADV